MGKPPAGYAGGLETKGAYSRLGGAQLDHVRLLGRKIPIENRGVRRVIEGRENIARLDMDRAGPFLPVMRNQLRLSGLPLEH